MVGLTYELTPIFDYTVDLTKIQSVIFLIIFTLFVPVRLFIFTLFFANPAIEETSN